MPCQNVLKINHDFRQLYISSEVQQQTTEDNAILCNLRNEIIMAFEPSFRSRNSQSTHSELGFERDLCLPAM